MVKLKYGQDTLNEIRKDIDKINRDITALIAERDSVQAELNKTADDYSLEVIKMNEQQQGHLDVLNKAIERAEAQKTKLIDGNADENLQKAERVISQVKTKVRDSQDEKYNLIKTKMDEIRVIFADIQAFDRQVESDVQAFVKEMLPYMSDKPLTRLGGTFSTPKATLNNRTNTLSYEIGGLRYVKLKHEQGYPLKEIVK